MLLTVRWVDQIATQRQTVSSNALFKNRKTVSMYDSNRLIELVKQHALEFGDFTLASGKKASYYLDCRKLTLDGESANVIAEGMLELMKDNLPEAVGGMAIGADPITASVVTLA